MLLAKKKLYQLIGQKLKIHGNSHLFNGLKFKMMLKLLQFILHYIKLIIFIMKLLLEKLSVILFKNMKLPLKYQI